MQKGIIRTTNMYLNAVIDFEMRRKDLKVSSPLYTKQLYFSFRLTIRCALGIYKSARQLAPKTRYARFGEPRKLAEPSAHQKQSNEKSK